MKDILRSSEHCMPNLTPMKPWAFLNAKKFPTIDRCAQIPNNIEEYDENGFVSFRNYETENYKYILPIGTPKFASFSQKQKPKPFEDRVSVDEVDLMIRDKLINDRFFLQSLFTSEDIHKRGFITKEAFMKIIMSICPYVSVDHFYKLLERYNLNARSVITFQDFESAFTEPPRGQFKAPEIFHGMGHPYKVTSAFGLHLFREAALEKEFNLHEILPTSCFEDSKRILMPQLREALARIKINFCDEDFIRFWNKLDVEGVGSIPLQKLLDVLNLQDDGTPMCGIRRVYVPKKREKRERILRPKCPLKYKNCYMLNNKDNMPHIGADGTSFPIIKTHCWKPRGPGGTNEYPFGRGSQFADGLEFVRNRRPKFASIFHCLQYIFEEPYQNMKIIFAKYDSKDTGFVPLCVGLKILCEYDFSVELPNLEKFLTLHGAYDVHNGMNYKKILNNFQQKGFGTLVNRGIDKIIIARGQASGLSSLNTMSVEEIERKFYETLHRDFINFQEMLQKCSPDQTYVLEKNMRKAIEKILGYTMNEQQWEKLQEHFDYNFDVGDEDNCLVNYKEFLKKFDKPTNICRYRIDPLLDEKSDLLNRLYTKGTDIYDPPRNASKICRLVADTLKMRFHYIDKEYKTFPDSLTSTLTKATLMELLNNQKCKLTPQEMNVIWAVVEAMPNYNSLHYRQILKCLMSRLYKRAAEIAVEQRREKLAGIDNTENMKVLVQYKKMNKYNKAQKKADIEHTIETSLKPNLFQVDPEIVKSVIQRILPQMKSIWKSFKKQLRKIDLMGTTSIELFEMRDLLRKNDFQLNENEMNHLLYAFDEKRNGRFYYINFLSEFTKLNFSEDGAKPDLHFDRVRHNLLNTKTGSKVTITETYKILRVYFINKWKSLVRAFRKIDVCKTGLIDMDQLNIVLKDAGMVLSKDDLFLLFTGFDTNLDGYIDYIEFIEQLLDVFVPNPA